MESRTRTDAIDAAQRAGEVAAESELTAALIAPHVSQSALSAREATSPDVQMLYERLLATRQREP
jgi:hypothetical protein